MINQENSMLQIEGHNFFIGANDNILKNESTNKNDLILLQEVKLNQE